MFIDYSDSSFDFNVLSLIFVLLYADSIKKTFVLNDQYSIFTLNQCCRKGLALDYVDDRFSLLIILKI